MYLQEVTTEEIVPIISKFCRLAGIDPPPNGREFIAFIQLGYGKYPLAVVDKAVDSWVMGSIDVKAPKVMNVKFMSDVIRLYIEANHHNIQKKPREYKMLSAPEPPKTDIVQVAKMNYTKIKAGERIDIFPTTMALAWDELNTEVSGNVQEAIAFIKGHEIGMKNHYIKKLGKIKVNNYAISEDIYQKAAKFILWCDGKNK